MRGPLKGGGGGCSVSARRDDESAGRCRSPPIAEVTITLSARGRAGVISATVSRVRIGIG